MSFAVVCVSLLELGQADSEDLRSGPPDLPKLPGANAGYQRD